MSRPQLDLPFLEKGREPRNPQGSVPIDDSFPEQHANELARLESYNKNLFRPNTYLHKWWARRSGVTFRLILKQLVADMMQRDYYAPGGLEGTTVLDPMMGGGTTLHEAIRLGANVIGYDIDPIPVLQVRASLSKISVGSKELAFEEFMNGLKNKLATYYRTRCPTCSEIGDLRFVLSGARKSCPCEEVIVIDSYLLREETDGSDKYIQHYYPAFEVRRGRKRWRLIEKKNARCGKCDQAFGNCTELHFPDRFVPLVAVGFCTDHGQFFKAIDTHDLHAIKKATAAANRLSLPAKKSLRVTGGPKSGDLLAKGIELYASLFTPRQLLYVSSAKKMLETVKPEHRLWLALLVSTSLEFNSILCGFKGAEKRRPGAIRHVFSHHAYSFPYTSLESNPIFPHKTSGTLLRLFEDRVKNAANWATAPIERKHTASGWRKVAISGETDWGVECSSIKDFVGQTKRFLVKQLDSSHVPLPDSSVDFVVTDPPYFDSVQYSDLSHFFRVWLQWFCPKEADWDFGHLGSAVAEPGSKTGKYRAVMTAILGESNRVLRRPHGRLIFTFHHWRADAWIELTLALKSAGFRLVNNYTVHSENPISVHIRQLKALTHDSILVLKPIDFLPPIDNLALPPKIDTADSLSFCRGCARLLGFCLDSLLSDSDIERLWQSSLGN